MRGPWRSVNSGNLDAGTLRANAGFRLTRSVPRTVTAAPDTTLAVSFGRIEALLGVKLDAPSSIAPLFVALKMRNVVGVYLGSDAEILTAGTDLVSRTAWS